jgi:hypothetical protein
MPASIEEMCEIWTKTVLDALPPVVTFETFMNTVRDHVLAHIDREDAHTAFLDMVLNRAYNEHKICVPPPIEYSREMLHEMYDYLDRCPGCGMLFKNGACDWVSYREMFPVKLCSRECLHDWTS